MFHISAKYLHSPHGYLNLSQSVSVSAASVLSPKNSQDVEIGGFYSSEEDDDDDHHLLCRFVSQC